MSATTALIVICILLLGYPLVLLLSVPPFWQQPWWDRRRLFPAAYIGALVILAWGLGLTIRWLLDGAPHLCQGICA